MESLIKIFVHEMSHAFYFISNIFVSRFPEYNGKPYFFLDNDGVAKIQGPSILQQIRSHFECASIDGGACLGLPLGLLSFSNSSSA